MTVTRVYNGTPSSNVITFTESITKAVALYVIAPDITDEIEIDFYLQLEISPSSNKLIKLNDNFILDTIVVYPIPLAFQDLQDLTIYGAFTSSLNVNIEIWVVDKETTIEDLLQEILEQLLELKQDVAFEQARNIATDIAFALSQQQVSIGLGILATGLIPITGGVSSTALPFFSGGTGILTPVTFGGLLGGV